VTTAQTTTGTPATAATPAAPERHLLLDPGMDLTLRPMRYPRFYDRFRDAIRNTWTVEEIDLHSDLPDLARLSPAERHLVSRLVAFFATGDTIVANNLVLNLYQHVNSPEGRLYLSRQLFEEAVHVQFYLTLLDTYVPDEAERAAAFAAVANIPSIARKAEFCFKWIDSIFGTRELRTAADRRSFLLNLICFAACIEGLTGFTIKKAAFVARYRAHPEYGNRTAAGRVAAELAPLAGLQPGTRRTYIGEELRKLTDLAARSRTGRAGR